MKTMMMIAASLAVMATSGAFAQGSNSDACHSQMIPCLDQCTSRPSKSLQETCSRVCENNANACYTKLYGNPGRPQGPQDALNSASDPVKSSKAAR